MKIIQTIIASAVAATIVTMLALPKVEAGTVQTMQNHVDMATAALACATTVGYVHRPVAAKVLAFAEQYSKEQGYMSTAMEKVQIALPNAIFTLLGNNDGGKTVCQKIARLIKSEYGFTD